MAEVWLMNTVGEYQKKWLTRRIDCAHMIQMKIKYPPIINFRNCVIIRRSCPTRVYPSARISRSRISKTQRSKVQ
jgi:hypothetical protein